MSVCIITIFCFTKATNDVIKRKHVSQSSNLWRVLRNYPCEPIHSRKGQPFLICPRRSLYRNLPLHALSAHWPGSKPGPASPPFRVTGVQTAMKTKSLPILKKPPHFPQPRLNGGSLGHDHGEGGGGWALHWEHGEVISQQTRSTSCAPGLVPRRGLWSPRQTEPCPHHRMWDSPSSGRKAPGRAWKSS